MKKEDLNNIVHTSIQDVVNDSIELYKRIITTSDKDRDMIKHTVFDSYIERLLISQMYNRISFNKTRAGSRIVLSYTEICLEYKTEIMRLDEPLMLGLTPTTLPYIKMGLGDFDIEYINRTCFAHLKGMMDKSVFISEVNMSLKRIFKDVDNVTRTYTHFDKSGNDIFTIRVIFNVDDIIEER